MLVSLFLILCSVVLRCVQTAPSARGKCSLECYSRCMQSGAPSAVYCNCSVERSHRSCNAVDPRLNGAITVPTSASFSSEYLDAHTIRLQIPAYSSAFVYVFDYATVSTQSDEWYFAGASTTPITTFTVLDPCRDYKFRVIAVVRSANPHDQFVIYGQKVIPVQLPPFTLTSDQIIAEPPLFNATTDTLKVYIRWTLPRGYSDADIYGYEAPALYPLQCRTPEDELPQPKIEIVRAGGRLAVTLPSSVLEARCRLWVEVRMLPRCVRLEPFSVQKNIEIDCDKNPELDVCTKEANPVCMEVVDIRGERGHATITWLPAARTPLYYHVRYGPAHMKGNPPFVTWQLATKRDIKVDGTVTTLTLDAAEDQDFGVQVCAIITPHRKRPKFGLVRVTPFQCTSCNNKPTLAVGRCGECGRIEGTTVADGSWKGVIKDNAFGRQAPKGQANKVPPQTVFRMETDLLVKGHARAAGANLSVAQLNAKSGGVRISLDRAEEINEQASTTTSSSLVTSMTTAVTLPTTTVALTVVQEAIETTAASEPRTLDDASSTPHAVAAEPATSTAVLEKGGEKQENATITSTEIVDVEADLRFREPLPLTHKSISTAPTRKTAKTGTSSAISSNGKSDAKERHEDSSVEKKLFSNKPEESAIHRKKTLEEVERRSQGKLDVGHSSSEPVVLVPKNLVSTKDIVRNELELSPAERRHHEKSKKCLLSTGIVCMFGCETTKTCRCPLVSHFLSTEGGCLSRDTFGHTLCLPKSDVNATWDPASMNILVRSQEASDHIRSVNNADYLFVEFGKLRDEEPSFDSLPGILRFNDQNRSRLVVAIEKLIRSHSFSSEPFTFHVNDSVRADASYGMRFCTYNSTQIKDPYAHNWDLDINVNKTGNIVQLSPVHFTNDLRSEMVPRPSRETFWNAFFITGKVVVLVVLVVIMLILLYLNCSRIRMLYDRKRTHYFRPYYIDSQVHVSALHPYTAQTALQKRSERSGYYDNHSRVI